VFGAALALFYTVGFVNAFGVFQEYYMENLEGYSASDISWIGSVSLFVFYAGSPFIGILVDRIGPAVRA
jgi:MFS family permease